MKFLIIGNKNAITYKDVFAYIVENKLRTGYRNINSDMWFIVPEQYEHEKIKDGKRVKHIMACWFTNLDVQKHDENLTLYKKYTPEEYPQYDNYDAINVNKVAEIPYDYEEAMGVPITFLDKYNPEQFEILGITDRANTSGMRTKKYTLEDSTRYNDLNARGIIKTDNTYKAIYARILIRKRQNKK